MTFDMFYDLVGIVWPCYLVSSPVSRIILTSRLYRGEALKEDELGNTSLYFNIAIPGKNWGTPFRFAVYHLKGIPWPMPKDNRKQVLSFASGGSLPVGPSSFLPSIILSSLRAIILRDIRHLMQGDGSALECGWFMVRCR
jgi:hypothetical protein